tara:strand:+ start:453 stop:1064 length:612 start_codon:yes stop_codon:yes gene_type:complete
MFLPEDLWVTNVSKNLTLNELSKIIQSCKYFKSILDTEELWVFPKVTLAQKNLENYLQNNYNLSSKNLTLKSLQIINWRTNINFNTTTLYNNKVIIDIRDYEDLDVAINKIEQRIIRRHSIDTMDFIKQIARFGAIQQSLYVRIIQNEKDQEDIKTLNNMINYANNIISCIKKKYESLHYLGGSYNFKYKFYIETLSLINFRY